MIGRLAPRSRGGVVGLLVAWTITCSSDARGEPLTAGPPPRVAIVDDAADGGALSRELARELALLDVAVVRLAPDPGDDTSAGLVARARAFGSFGAVRIVHTPEGVEVWVADQLTGAVVLRQAASTPASELVRSQILVVRTVELLRASLMEATLPRRDPAPALPAARVQAVPQRSPPRARIALDVGAGVVVGGGALGVRRVVGGAADLRLGARIGLAVHAWAPLSSHEVSDREGTAAVGFALVAGTARLDLLGEDGPWTLAVGAGPAAIRLSVRGSAAAGYRAAAASRWVPGGLVRVAMGRQLVGALRLAAELTGGALLGTADVRFAGRSIAPLGPFFLCGGLALGVVW